MPSTYAHYTFGRQVLDLLDADLSTIIYSNLPIYHIGLHGPDIFFYYRPYTFNSINQLGIEIHQNPATSFFMNAKSIISNLPNPSAALSYILGTICHFMLDSECHPIVNRWQRQGVSHFELETEFERYLMISNHIDPITSPVTDHINVSYDYSTSIGPFYNNLNDKLVYKAIKSMKFYLDFLVPSSQLKKSILSTAFKISGYYDTMIGLVMRENPNTLCKLPCEILYEKYLRAINPTAKLLMEYFSTLYSHETLNHRFDRKFV